MMKLVRCFGSRISACSGGATASWPANPPNIDGTTRFAASRSSWVAAGETTPPGGGGGGGNRVPTTAAGVTGTAARSGVDTLNLGSSPGALLQPKIVQPPFSV